MNIIITGATGMVGSAVLKEALADSAFESVTALVRSPLAIQHPKLKTIIHNDFLDYSGLEETFRDNDACVWCLGISQNQVDAQQYVKITYDYTVAAAKAMLGANPNIGMLFVSGEGASSTEQSQFLFGRMKGKAENALIGLPFKKLFIARPAGIQPSDRPANNTFVLKAQYALVRLMRFIMPWYVITSQSLAKALLHVVKNGAKETILSYGDLSGIAKKLTNR